MKGGTRRWPVLNSTAWLTSLVSMHMFCTISALAKEHKTTSRGSHGSSDSGKGSGLRLCCTACAHTKRHQFQGAKCTENKTVDNCHWLKLCTCLVNSRQKSSLLQVEISNANSKPECPRWETVKDPTTLNQPRQMSSSAFRETPKGRNLLR